MMEQLTSANRDYRWLVSNNRERERRRKEDEAIKAIIQQRRDMRYEEIGVKVWRKECKNGGYVEFRGMRPAPGIGECANIC